MRKLVLWLVALGALVAPVLALDVRVRERRESTSQLAQGLAVFEAPIEHVIELESADIARARALFERAWRGDPEGETGARARALMHVAQAYQDLSRNEVVLATQEADTAERLRPGDPHVELLAATVAARRGEGVRAERALDRLARAPRGMIPAPVSARAAMLRVDLLLDAGRVHEALAVIESLDRDHPAVGAIKNRLGLARAAVGDRAGAREAFQRAAEIDPSHEAPLVNLARLAREEGDLQGARALLERAIGVAPESPEAWLAYGVVLGDLRDPRARRALVRAGELAPDDAAPWLAQGDLDLAEGHLEGALESFRQALARDPDNVAAETNLGVVLARRGERAGAIEAFERATRRSPHQGQAWNGLGAMRLAQGDAQGALGPLQQASALLPEDPNPPMNLGLALEALQRWDDAGRAYREVLRRAPGHEAALRRLLAITPERDRPRELRRVGRLASRE